MQGTLQQPVKDFALRIKGATRVFEESGIDYCCGGATPLGDACAAAGIDADAMLATLRALEDQNRGADTGPDFETMRLAALTEHIVQKHHIFTVREFERLGGLMDKVLTKHGPSHAELKDVSLAFERLRDDLLPHMQKEERVLFPFIEALETAALMERPAPIPPFGTVQNPIRMMMLEHDAAGEILRELRTATSDYRAPADACMSFQALYEGLEGLEKDLHEHIHIENNVLFPRAAALE